MTLSPLVTQIILVLFAAGLAFVAARYWYTRHAKDAKEAADVADVKAMAARITELERQLLTMASDVQPISAAFRAILIKQLTHFHTPVLDALMEKIGPPSTFTEEDLKLMVSELKARQIDMGPEIDDSERNAAKILPLLIERMLLDTEEEASVLKVVAVPIPPTEPDEPSSKP